MLEELPESLPPPHAFNIKRNKVIKIISRCLRKIIVIKASFFNAREFSNPDTTTSMPVSYRIIIRQSNHRIALA